jgi:GT2 family glycosyltransferase
VRLTIVIVCFGGEATRLLDELGRQRRAVDEVVVVDNLASQGGTRGVAGHPVIDRLIEPPINLGYAAGVNLGATDAGGDALLLLNPDAVPQPGCLEALRAPPAGWQAWMGLVLLGDGTHVNTAGGVSHFLGFSWAGRYGEPASALPSEPYACGFLSGACLAVRAETWRALGGFADHYFMYHEDVDLSHRLRLAGAPFGVLPAAQVVHDYAFAKGAAKWRLLEANRWKTVLRTYPPPLLALLAPILLAVELPLLVVALAGGWLDAKLRAWADVLAWLPRAPGERRAIQAARTVDADTFAAGLVSPLDSPFLGPVGRSRPLAVLLELLWRAVRSATRAPRRG